MPVLSSDILYHAALLMPEDDVSASGGAIDTSTIVAPFTELDVTGQLEVVSSAAGDTTQTVTLTYRDAAGIIQTTSKVLTGTTAVAFTPVDVERILKVVLSAAAAGVVTVQKQGGGTVQVDIPIGMTGARRLFYDSSAEATGGAQRKYYEKLFIKNNHGTLAVTGAQILEAVDPSGKIAFALATAKDDSVQVANRLTAPAGGLVFDSAAKNVPTGNLGAAEAIGVWLELTLAAGDAAAKTSYTPQITGKSA